MKRAALAYASRFGWRVFGTAADCRSPIKRVGDFEHGVHDASSDLAEIERRWTVHPDANIALACGPASGVLALDVDRKGNVDGWADLMRLAEEFGPIPETPTQGTPSGGLHLLFRHPTGLKIPNRVGLKRYAPDGTRTVYPGLDVRAEGASIALAPSRKPNGVYSWKTRPGDVELAPVPRWLLALMLSEPPPRPPKPPLRIDSTERAARYVASAVNREMDQLARTAAGQGRNQRLFVAAANLGEFVGAGLLTASMAESELEAAATTNGLVRDDGLYSVRGTIKSGLTKGMAKPREIALGN